MNQPLRVNAPYPKRDKVDLFFSERLGMPSGYFAETIRRYTNGLLNTSGGLLVFGVDSGGIVRGLRPLTRSIEDAYRLALDREIRRFLPTVSPNLFRFHIRQTEDRKMDIVEVRVGAGPTGEMFMDSRQEVHIIRGGVLYGPLIPQDIRELVLAKFKEELWTTHNLLSPAKEVQ